jgi:hypothetical protein
MTWLADESGVMVYDEHDVTIKGTILPGYKPTVADWVHHTLMESEIVEGLAFEAGQDAYRLGEPRQEPRHEAHGAAWLRGWDSSVDTYQRKGGG